jgi:Icc protein
VNALPGRLGPEQRQWLARKIDSDPAPAIVCLHHNPSRSLTGLRDAAEFLDIILPRRRVKAVIFGHTHELRLRQTDGLHFVNLPACGYCLLLKPNVPLGWVRASVRQDGMLLEFRGVTPGERDHGKTFNLSWRSEA